MKSNSPFLALVMTGRLSGMVGYTVTIGTDSLAITFSSELISGTRNLEVQDGVGAATGAMDVDNIYKNDVGIDAVEEPFYTVFKECAGMSDIYTATQATGGTCDSINYPANDVTSTNAPIQVRQEEHSSRKTPCPLNCAMTLTGGDDTTRHSFGTSRLSTNVTSDVYATLVLTSDKAALDIGAGTTTAPIAFSISYEQAMGG